MSVFIMCVLNEDRTEYRQRHKHFILAYTFNIVEDNKHISMKRTSSILKSIKFISAKCHNPFRAHRPIRRLQIDLSVNGTNNVSPALHNLRAAECAIKRYVHNSNFRAIYRPINTYVNIYKR